MQEKNTDRDIFSEVFERIRRETDIKNTVQLAKIVGFAQPTVSKKKKLKKFPVEWAYTIGQKYGILTEWIMKGIWV